MLILFFNSKGVIHHKYVPEKQTVNATFLHSNFGPFMKIYCPCGSEMWRDRKFFLLPDNTYLHTAAIIQQFLAKKGVDS